MSTTAPPYSPVGSDFQGLTARTLGNAGTSSDGFDSLIVLPISSFDSDFATLSELDAALAAIDFVDGLFSAINHDPISAALNAFYGTGDSLIGDLGTIIGQ